MTLNDGWWYLIMVEFQMIDSRLWWIIMVDNDGHWRITMVMNSPMAVNGSWYVVRGGEYDVNDGWSLLMLMVPFGQSWQNLWIDWLCLSIAVYRQRTWHQWYPDIPAMVDISLVLEWYNCIHQFNLPCWANGFLVAILPLFHSWWKDGNVGKQIDPMVQVCGSVASGLVKLRLHGSIYIIYYK